MPFSTCFPLDSTLQNEGMKTDFPIGTQVLIDCGEFGEHSGVVIAHYTQAEWATLQRTSNAPAEGVWRVRIETPASGDPIDLEWVTFREGMSYAEKIPSRSDPDLIDQWLES